MINVSLGSNERSTAVEWLLLKALTYKVTVVASADNSDNDSVTFPANRAIICPWIRKTLVSVSSVNAEDEKSSFFAYNRYGVETVAPDENILTAFADEQVIYWSGTSFAAPMVSGTLALALGEPNLDKKVEDLPELVTEKVMDKFHDIEANSGAIKDALAREGLT